MANRKEATLETTLNECVEAWLERVKDKRAPGTIDRYRSVYGNKLEQGIGRLTLAELIEPARLFDYAEELLAAGCTRSDITTRFTIISGALTRPRARRVITDDPTRGVLAGAFEGAEPEEKESVEPFTADEIRRIIRRTDKKNKAAMIVLFKTGMRLGELCGLNFDCVDLRNREITIKRSYRAGVLSEHTKNKLVRTISLDDELVTIFDKLKKSRKRRRVTEIDGGPVFTRNGRRLCQNTFRYGWKKALDKARVDYRKVHAARHTRGTSLLSLGFSPAVVADLLGHSPTMLLSGYRHATKDDSETKREMVGAM